MVDVQPHYFGGLIDRVDLVIDHHPEQPGYTAVFKDIRADYGSTCTILTEHLRAVDVNISERTATAMLYAIKSDTLFFNRQTNRVDLEAFSYLYPLADAALIRKMEGAEITLERLDYVMKAHAVRHARRAGVLRVPRRVAARGLHPLRRRLLPAARGREVDDHRRHRERVAGHLGAEPRLLEERRRVRAAVLRRHRQRRRPPRDGEGRRADGGVPREVRRSDRRGHRPPSCRTWSRSSCTKRRRTARTRRKGKVRSQTSRVPRPRKPRSAEPFTSFLLLTSQFSASSLPSAPDPDPR